MRERSCRLILGADKADDPVNRLARLQDPVMPCTEHRHKVAVVPGSRDRHTVREWYFIVFGIVQDEHRLH